MYRIRFQISQRDTRPKPRSVYCWEGLYTVGRYCILLERSRKAGFFVVNFVVFVLGVF